jgi:hypothetical protein
MIYIKVGNIFMLIEICKKTQYACEYSITRDDTTQEHFTLETKTYFLHDICHYVVEKQLQFNKGFGECFQSGIRFKSFSEKKTL